MSTSINSVHVFVHEHEHVHEHERRGFQMTGFTLVAREIWHGVIKR